MAILDKTSFKALYGSSGTTFPNNTTELIEEGDLRQFGEDQADSFMSLADNFIDEDSFATDSATKAPSQQSTKAYITAQIAASLTGLAWKNSVLCATTANITLSGLQTIDGIFAGGGSRVLVKNQSTASQNGIYVTGAGAWVRATDNDSTSEMQNAVVSVDQGTTNADTSWRQTTDSVTVGSSNVVWASFGAAAGAATESSAGIAEIATQSETDTGTDDSRFVTPLKIQTKLGSGFSNNPDLYIRYVTDFHEQISPSYPVGPCGYISSGANGSVSGGLSTADAALNVQGAVGMLYSNNAGAFVSIYNNSSSIFLGTGTAVYRRIRARVSLLSDGTNRHTVFMGFRQNPSLVTAATEGVFFRYVDNVNSGRWEAVTVSDGTETATDTGITVDTSYHIFEITINSTGTSIVFKIDGATVATNTTNIPIESAEFISNYFQVVRSLGTSSTNSAFTIDWDETVLTRTTAR